MKKQTFLFVFVLLSYCSFAQTNTSTKEVFKAKDGKLYIKQTTINYTPVTDDFSVDSYSFDNFNTYIPNGVSTQVKLDSINAQLKRYKAQSELKEKENAKILADLKANGWVSREEKRKKEELAQKIKNAEYFNSVNKVKN